MASYRQVNSAATLQNVDTRAFEQHIFYVGEDGSLNQTWWDPHSGWNSRVLPGSPASDPVVTFYPTDETYYDVFFRDINGHLSHVFWSVVDTDGTRGWSSPGTLPGAPVGNVAVGLYIGGPSASLEEHIFYIEADGAVHQTWTANPTNPTGNEVASQPLQGSPISSSSPLSGISAFDDDGKLHVFYVGQDGVLAQTWWDGHRWQSQALKGRPSRLLGVLSYYWNRHPELHVFFRADDGSLQQTWWDGFQWQKQSLPAATPVRS